MIDLTPQELELVRSILKRHVPARTVKIFGSRVTGKAKPFSDIDLVVMGDQPLTLHEYASLKEDFTESNLRYKVDVVDWATTSESFRRIIESHAVPLR